MPVTIRCAHCKGTGRIPLTGVYADTLALLRQQVYPVTGAELAQIAHCTGPAMNNRLAALERLGLCTSERCGVKRLYVAVKEAQRSE